MASGTFLDTVFRTDRCVHAGHDLLALWVVLGKVGKHLHDLRHQDLAFGSVSNLRRIRTCVNEHFKSLCRQMITLSVPNKNQIKAGNRVWIETKRNQGKGRLTEGNSKKDSDSSKVTPVWDNGHVG